MPARSRPLPRPRPHLVRRDLADRRSRYLRAGPGGDRGRRRNPGGWPRAARRWSASATSICPMPSPGSAGPCLLGVWWPTYFQRRMAEIGDLRVVWAGPGPINPHMNSFPPGAAPPPLFRRAAGGAGARWRPLSAAGWPQLAGAGFKACATRMPYSILSLSPGSFSDAELRAAVAAYADFDAPVIAPLADRRGPICWSCSTVPPWLSRTSPAGVGAVVQPRPGQARRPRHRRRRHQRRYRLGGDRGAGRIAQHRCLRDAPQGPGQHGAAAADDHQPPCQCPQYRAGRHLRRRPGDRESALRRYRIRTADQADRGQFDQFRPHRRPERLFLHRHRTGKTRHLRVPPASSATSSRARRPCAWVWTWRGW